ncbi:30S ribosomal protein S13 [Candidatus Woesearchaeota archaeon]|nr:30S ribosomal protein S13 [Candidatus Woesearchaeota archaeon]
MVQEENKGEFRHLIRIANVDLPGEEPIRFALTRIKGIGINFADAVCAVSSIQKQMKTGHLSDAEISRLNMAVMEPLKAGIPSWMFNRKRDCETGEDKHFLSGSLNFNQDNDLKRLKKIKTLRGMRHQRGLPVRGQRTRSNFRKMKGKVVGVVKKKLEPTAEKGDKKGGSDKKDKKDKK